MILQLSDSVVDSVPNQRNTFVCKSEVTLKVRCVPWMFHTDAISSCSSLHSVIGDAHGWFLVAFVEWRKANYENRLN